MSETDLFGEEIKLIHSNGYAANPGTGPYGQKCRDCKYFVRHKTRSAKTYFKCGLINWTNGSGTDIKASSPACYRFEEDA